MKPLRQQYEQHGVQQYYRGHGARYRNPHESVVQRLLSRMVEEWPVDTRHVLDLACGSGEVTLALGEVGITNVDGVDPYTHAAYRNRTGRRAERLTFEQIAAGAMSEKAYSLIICSFALHLVEKSRLAGIVLQLSLVAPQLAVITPNKRPHIAKHLGWRLIEEMEISRVKARLYRSQQHDSGAPK
ncbi:MAG: class I SAM-dependent methyltransferase [Gammaproteobacteria bacterium]